MSRIKDLQKQVHRVLEKIEDEDKRLKAVSHLHGVALAAVLAKKRGENAELATMAGLLQEEIPCRNHHNGHGISSCGCTAFCSQPSSSPARTPRWRAAHCRAVSGPFCPVFPAG